MRMKTKTVLFCLPGILMLFLPLGLNGKSPLDNGSDSLELRGVMRLQGKWKFSIRDTISQSSFWLETGKPVNGISVVEYDSAGEILTISNNGLRRKMMLVDPDPAHVSVVRSTTMSVLPPGAEQFERPPVPTMTPPPPPNNGRPPKLPAPDTPPKPLPANSGPGRASR